MMGNTVAPKMKVLVIDSTLSSYELFFPILIGLGSSS